MLKDSYGLNLEELISSINEDLADLHTSNSVGLPTFVAHSPISVAIKTDMGWRTTNLMGDTVTLIGLRIGIKAVICQFLNGYSSPLNCYPGFDGVGLIEIGLAKSEASLSDFKEWLLIQIDLECYLSEYIEKHELDVGHFKKNKVKKVSVERNKIERPADTLWGSW